MVAGTLAAQVREIAEAEDEGPNANDVEAAMQIIAWLGPVDRYRGEGLRRWRKSKKGRRPPRRFEGKSNLSVEDAVARW